jgi:hypothetical protein
MVLRHRARAQPALPGRVEPVRRSALRPARHLALPVPRSAPERSAAVHCAGALPGLQEAANRRGVHPSAVAAVAAARQAQRSAPPGAVARQAAALQPAEPVGPDAEVPLPEAADAAGAPQAGQGAEAVARAARRAVRALRAAPGVAAAALPGGAAEVLRAGAAAGLPWAAPDAPARPSGVVWVFRRDRLRRLAPSRSGRFARATARLRSALLSRQSWQAARDEGLS